MSGTEIVPRGGPNLQTSKSARRLARRDNDDMPQDLLEFHSPSAALVAMPPSALAQYMIWLVCSMAVVMLIVFATVPLDRVVTVSGELISTRPTLLVQPFATSIVRSIEVHEGEIVHKGQVLARLDPTVSTADEANLKNQTQSYAAQIARLKAEAAGDDYKPDLGDPASVSQAAIFMRRREEFRDKLLNYTQQIASLQSDMQGYRANAAMYAGRVKVAGDVTRMRRQLQHDQVGSRLDSLSAQDSLMEMERSQLSAQEGAVGAKNKLDAERADEAGYIQDWKAQIYQDLTDTEHKYSDARADYEKAILARNLDVMRAQGDAEVLTIAKVSIGSVLTPATQLITLVPLDAPLEVEAKLKGDESGYVKIGDKAMIKFATFAYTQYGGADATVRGVSADSFTKDSLDQSTSPSAPPLDMGSSADTFYRIKLRIDRYTLHGVPNYFHPTPGMPVTADIKVGKRTIMQYLLNRVLPVATEGMREP
ncbi:HlyD family type I secretion periplasmic adaptor subunit [Lichenicoccus sp.]|uniref:HlyD family type I secretion periplasmic adaptor subunit n=1 Tax=Lichenicoccus sp. TaxID=2781899 RepID=UPI003D0F21C4